jgi:hypothetical protein
MRLFAWIKWLYLQVAFPIAAGIVMAGAAGIPFVFFWPPMTKVEAVSCAIFGVCFALYCFWAQWRKIKTDKRRGIY